MEINKDKEAVVETFFKQNNVLEGWKNLILDNDNVVDDLFSIIGYLRQEGANERFTPEGAKILRAFAHCDPENIEVVIIGTSPITNGLANGLSFSTDLFESEFKDNKGAAIRRVHDALREAGILKEGVDYHCGHEEWATGGVLLLNAALTIEKTSGDKDKVSTHCLIWQPFLRSLLTAWIEAIIKVTKDTEPKPTISVMLWGYAMPYDEDCPNYAKKVWKGILPQNCEVFKVYYAHHPTWPSGDLNNYIDRASGHFKKLPDSSKEIFKNTIHRA